MSQKTKVAINGFGRIGRATLKSLINKKNLIDVVAINDLTDINTLAYLMKYDSCYGVYDKKIEVRGNELIVGGMKIKILAEKDPANLPWKELEVDVVIESTGRFRSKEDASLHLKAGAKKVIISAPAKGDGVKTFVLGVNENKIKKTDKIISNASCTTNCLAPITEIIRQNFGIEKAIMTTIHSYTADQNLIDGPHKDLRRARSAGLNMVPTSTGAAAAVAKTIPQLKDKFDGISVRVPTPVGSITDVVFLTKKRTDEKTINNTLRKASKTTRFKGIIGVSDDPIVLSDIVGTSESTIVDLPFTKVVDGNLVKILAWYDNEWGYANRLVDLVGYMSKKKLI